MYIRKSKERKSGKLYESYRLVESIRIDGKPRQRTLLNLGADFRIPVERHKELCGLIEEKLFLQNNEALLSDEESDLESMANSIVRKIVVKESKPHSVVAGNQAEETVNEADWLKVNLDSVENSDIRSFGGEAICLDMINRLGIYDKLKEMGFTSTQRALAIGSITARLLSPGSDRSSFHWLQETSAVDYRIT